MHDQRDRPFPGPSGIIAATAAEADRERLIALRCREFEQLVGAVGKARPAPAVVVVHPATGFGDRRVGVIVKRQLFTGIITRRLDLGRHRDERAGSHQDRDRLEGDRHLDVLSPFVALVVPEIEPCPGRQIDID